MYSLYGKDFFEWLSGKKIIDTDTILEIKFNSISISKLEEYKTTFDIIFDSLSKFKNLTNLEIDYSDIISLPNSIGNLTNLTHLVLLNNKITSLPDSIGRLVNLTYLDLTQNRLTEIPDSIGNLTHLITLKLSYNQLSNLPDSIGNLSALSELHINTNRLTKLPNSIGNLSALSELNIEYNGLTSLPDTFGDLTSLFGLNVSHNLLTSLPDTFGNLTSLNNLSIDHNKITSLPDSIGDLTNLEYLSLHRNELSKLPDTFTNLITLTDLYLHYNQLTELPDTIGNLIYLSLLTLSDNQLTELPDSIGELESLNSLYLSDNQLTNLPDSILDLTSLDEFEIDNNPGLNITNRRIRQFIRRFRNNNNNYNNNNNNNNNVPWVNPLQVHQAFEKINTQELFKFIKPTLSNNVNNIQNIDRDEFIIYIRSTLESFIQLIPKTNAKRKTVETDINNIFEYVLNNIAYTDDYKKVISYCLDYVSKQPDEFKKEYVSNFTYDCAHAYNAANGNIRGELSCPKGMIERFVFSLVPAAMLFIDTPTFTERGYDKLISIIENKPIIKPKANGIYAQSDLRRLIDEFAQECFGEAAPSGETTNNSENKFKVCLKQKLAERLGNSYNEDTVSRELDEYVPMLGLFGGFRKRRIIKTRKHKVRKTRKYKIRKIKKTRHYKHRK